jgi:hypothetical protein
MNANAITRHYGTLTAEERFRLILAASGRGDDAERERLAKAGGWITLSVPGHHPYAKAFEELAFLTFMELLDAAGLYFDAFACTGDTGGCCGEGKSEEEGDARGDGGPDAEACAEGAWDDAGERPPWQRALDVALAAGLMLRIKADGWRLFCERMNVPPFLLWEGLPGYDRLQRALRGAEGTGSFPGAAFGPEGFLRWVNGVRPKGTPEHTDLPFTVEGIASTNAAVFRQRAKWWGR